MLIELVGHQRRIPHALQSSQRSHAVSRRFLSNLNISNSAPFLTLTISTGAPRKGDLPIWRCSDATVPTFPGQMANLFRNVLAPLAVCTFTRTPDVPLKVIVWPDAPLGKVGVDWRVTV